MGMWVGHQEKPVGTTPPPARFSAACGEHRVSHPCACPSSLAHGHTSHSLRACAGGVCEGGRGDSLLPSPQTRVLVTHGISFLPQTDFIIVLADGQVSEMGPYPALLQRNGSFANFLHNYAPDEDQHLEDSWIGICCPGLSDSCAFPASLLSGFSECV